MRVFSRRIVLLRLENEHLSRERRGHRDNFCQRRTRLRIVGHKPLFASRIPAMSRNILDPRDAYFRVWQRHPDIAI